MTRRTVKTIPIVSVLNDRQRFASLVLLLMTIDKRTAPNKKNCKKYKLERKDTIARMDCGPCFYWRLIYHGLIDSALSIEINYDRYNSANIAQRCIQNN